MYETKLFKAVTSVFIAGIVLLIALNVFTPLRLTTDSIRYLNIMEYLGGKLGSDSNAAKDFFPHGYPYLLLGMEKLHLLSSLTIVIINIIAVVASGWLFCKLFMVQHQMVFISFLLLSFINIKHITLPLSDQLFTLAMLAACYDWKRVFEQQYKYIVPAVLFTLASVYLRTAGIVIPIAVVCFIVYSNREKLFKRDISKVIFFFVVAFVVAFILTDLQQLEKKVDYVRQLELNKMLQEPLSIPVRIGTHLQEMGEMLINIPASQVGRLLHVNSEGPVKWIYVLVGLAVCVVVIRSIIKLKLYQHFTAWVVFVYFLMIFVWPFYDTRFLVPVIPFILYCLFPFFHKKGTGKGTVMFTAVYILFGVLSLGYSTLLSVDKDKFLQYYGNEPKLTEAYRQYFAKKHLQGPLPQSTDANPDRALYLLYMYDK